MIFENQRIIVDTKDSDLSFYQESATRTNSQETYDQRLRGLILSQAMRKIGHQLVKPKQITEEQITKTESDLLIIEYLQEQGHYDLFDTFYRYTNNLHLSQGQLRDISLAQQYAEENAGSRQQEANKAVSDSIDFENQYHQSIAQTNWNITIKPNQEMPTQIGMCYQTSDGSWCADWYIK